jgi:radical SAM superfamily enzyme YgiQ (UPF0313 family)
MKKKIIYFSDLSHTDQVIASEFMPYSAACIASYFLANSRYADEFEVKVFKFPNDLIRAIGEREPYALAQSNTLWNSDLANQIAKKTKEVYPNTINVFGGPDFSEIAEEQKEWLHQRPWADFYVRLEGEVAFTNLIDALHDHNQDINYVKSMELNSVCAVKEGDFFAGKTEARLKKFEDIPSPYVMGLMDDFFETTLWPLVETNRGCPFSCAFCTEGMDYFNKVAKKSIDKVREELTYIAKNHKKQKMMFFADSNFLMFKENLEVCDIIGGLQKNYNWPTFIGSSTGKNRHELVVEGTRRLKGTIALSASVQHLDPVVQKNIKRENISTEDLFNVALAGDQAGTTTYTEVIACLPGDTLEKYRKLLETMVETELDIIRTHTLLLIHGTEFCTPEARKKFGFKTQFRATSKSFGRYKFFNGEDIPSVECEEIVTSTKTLPFEDYIECRRLQVTMHVFFNDDLFNELHKILKTFNIPIWTWIMCCHENKASYNSGTKALYNSYMNDVHSELFKTKEDVQADFEANYDKYINGERGSNVTFKHKALLFDKYVKDVLKTGFLHARNLLMKKDSENLNNILDFLDEVEQLNLMRKEDIFNTSLDTDFEVHFPVEDFLKADFTSSGLKSLDRPLKVRIEHSLEQKLMLDHYFENHAHNTIELAWLLNRVPARNMYRSLIENDVASSIDERTSVPEARDTAMGF